MKKISLYVMALMFFNLTAYAQQDHFWRSKPILCSETGLVLQSLKDDNYTPIGQSIITQGEEEKQIGFVWLFLKDGEIIIVENYGPISCLVSISKNYKPIYSKKNEL